MLQITSQWFSGPSEESQRKLDLNGRINGLDGAIRSLSSFQNDPQISPILAELNRVYRELSSMG